MKRFESQTCRSAQVVAELELERVVAVRREEDHEMNQLGHLVQALEEGVLWLVLITDGKCRDLREDRGEEFLYREGGICDGVERKMGKERHGGRRESCLTRFELGVDHRAFTENEPAEAEEGRQWL